MLINLYTKGTNSFPPFTEGNLHNSVQKKRSIRQKDFCCQSIIHFLSKVFPKILAKLIPHSLYFAGMHIKWL